MQAYPLDLATILYLLRGQSGRLQAALDEVPGVGEPCQAHLVLVEGKVISSFLVTRQGTLAAQGERAMSLLAELGVINWLWGPGVHPVSSPPNVGLTRNVSSVPQPVLQRGGPFNPEALRACSRIQRRVLGLVDGRRTTQEIATLLAIPPTELERLRIVLQELQAMGLITLD